MSPAPGQIGGTVRVVSFRARLENAASSHPRWVMSLLALVSLLSSAGLYATAAGTLPWIAAWPMLTVAAVAAVAAAEMSASRTLYALPVVVGAWCTYIAVGTGMLYM